MSENAVIINKKEEKPTGAASKIFKRITQDRVLMLVVLLGIIMVSMTLVYPESFPHWDNISAVLLDTAQSAILTVGMMCLLISGVFDISIGATLAFGGIIAGVMVKMWMLPPFVAVLGGLASGLCIGLVNGLIVTKIRVNAMITTLATQYILRGVTQIIAPSGIANLPESFKPFRTDHDIRPAVSLLGDGHRSASDLVS